MKLNYYYFLLNNTPFFFFVLYRSHFSLATSKKNIADYSFYVTNSKLIESKPTFDGNATYPTQLCGNFSISKYQFNACSNLHNTLSIILIVVTSTLIFKHSCFNTIVILFNHLLKHLSFTIYHIVARTHHKIPHFICSEFANICLVIRASVTVTILVFQGLPRSRNIGI